MKKLLYFLVAFAAVLALSSGCSNDFELTSPWKEIPVVFALLSPNDENHYVRVEKAFLDPETSALKVAEIVDSLYYREGEISVFLQKVGESTLYPLVRVDGNLEGHVRDTGIFANTPNWLYRIRNSELPGGLRPESTYRLVIKRANGEPDITAETTIPRAFTLISPTITSTPPVISFIGNSPTNFRWSHDANAVYFNVTLKIPYREQATDGSIILRDTFEWRAASNVLATPNGNGNTVVLLNGYAFYEAVANNITTPNDGRSRHFGSTVGIKVEGGGREIREYILTAEANAGLTGAEIVQTYTNLSEGYGVFSAKTVENKEIFRFTELTIDSLNAYPRTKFMNFKK